MGVTVHSISFVIVDNLLLTMDLLYDFSQSKSPTDALSSKYKQSGGRNRLWRDIQRDVKKKQNKMEKETEKVLLKIFVFFLKKKYI